MDPKVKKQEEVLTIMNSRFFKFKEKFAVAYKSLEADLRDEPYFHNLQNVLCTRTEPVYEADGIHLNAAGNRMVAEAMAKVLQKRGF